MCAEPHLVGAVYGWVRTKRSGASYMCSNRVSKVIILSGLLSETMY